MTSSSSLLHSHRLAKKLNDTAALCIETGHFDRGISCLVEALKHSDRDNTYHGSSEPYPGYLHYGVHAVCQCRHCSLDGCIVFSETIPMNYDYRSGSVSSGKDSSSSSKPLNNNDDTDDDATKSYIYQRPIRITPQSMQGGHNMGVTLSLIITFNLALAHHLSAMKSVETATILASCNQTFQKILHLYEFSYRWKLDLEEDHLRKQHKHDEQLGNSNPSLPQLDASPVTSLRFNMIVCNNLSQIHGLLQNHSKHKRCLEHLLATMMFVIVTYGAQQHEMISSPLASTSSALLSASSNAQRELQQQQQLQEEASTRQYMNFEGFLRNASFLILRPHCAGAA